MDHKQRRNLLYKYNLGREDESMFNFVIDHSQSLSEDQLHKIEMLSLRVEKLETFHHALLEIQNQVNELSYRVAQLES